jgi:alpha-glucosidase
MAWWEEVTFYQIYPRSFADANGDGIGDIRGIINKLDYLQWLGVGAIWLSPHYPSPQIDVGYDVSDYTDVNPEYGTLNDFKELLAEAHRRDMKLIIDFVLNHSSDQHKWFLESKSSRDNPKRDWYVWRDGKDGQPPNNWEAIFGGSAWQYDETTGQYYYHFFLKEQPDLNWRNPEVHQAMFDAMRFWLDMGVDGLRLDAIGTIYEDPAMTNHESKQSAFDVLKALWLGREVGGEGWGDSAFGVLFKYQHDLPEIHPIMQELRKMADEYPACFVVGETSDRAFLGDGTNQLHSVFNFDMLNTNRLRPEPIRYAIGKWLETIPKGAWISNTLNNHDQSRVMTHFGDGKNDIALAKLSAAVVVTLEGIPFLYYGEEIGMEDYSVQSFEELRDLVSNVYRELMLAEGKTDEEILTDLATFSRDRCRTPMQWDKNANAGFSPAGVKTWLPVHDNFRQGMNVAEQEQDEDSLLHFYRKLLHCRKDNYALQYGKYRVVDSEQNEYLAFLRESDKGSVLVLLNFSENAAKVGYSASAEVLLSNEKRSERVQTGALSLLPFEILVLQLN